MNRVSIITVSVLIALLSTDTYATNSWPESSKRAYIKRCGESLSSQGLEIKQANKLCSCITQGMENEFGMNEYKQMMKAEPDPNGGEYDRRLYKVFMAC